MSVVYDILNIVSFRRLKYHQPATGLRTQFIYNNAMYGLAGYVAEQIAGGQRYEDLLTSKIFDPLGMTSSTFNDEIDDWSQFSTPYVKFNSSVYPVDKELVR